MSNISKLGNLYGRLYGELAAALARHVTIPIKDWKPISDAAPGTKGAAFYHHSVSPLEAATVALTKFGLVTPLPRRDKPQETWFCHHELVMDADEMPDFLANSIDDRDDRSFDLLSAFVSVFCGYGDLSERHTPFSAPPHLRPAMSMLVRAGYATRDGDQYRWAGKIGPAMQAAYLWNESSISFSEAGEQQLAAEAMLAWETMPDTLKMTIRSGKASVFDVTKILALGWRDGQWHGFKLDDPVVLGHNELPVARRLFEIAQSEK